MDFCKLAETRYSVRKFTDRAIDKDTLNKILRSAQVAPTACNNQPQRVYVVQSAEALAKVRSCTPYHFNAPVILAICYDRTLTWKRACDGQCSGLVDASIVTTHLMLQAAELGLGTTWVGSFDPAKAAKALSLPANIIPVALLPLGYPDAAPAAMHTSRRTIAETVTWL